MITMGEGPTMTVAAIQDVIAWCEVRIMEIDFDLKKWREEFDAEVPA